MTTTKLALTAISVVFIIYLCSRQTVEGRYLPTRSNSDRIDKLKELLREVSIQKMGSRGDRWSFVF